MEHRPKSLCAAREKKTGSKRAFHFQYFFFFGSDSSLRNLDAGMEYSIKFYDLNWVRNSMHLV